MSVKCVVCRDKSGLWAEAGQTEVSSDKKQSYNNFYAVSFCVK